MPSISGGQRNQIIEVPREYSLLVELNYLTNTWGKPHPNPTLASILYTPGLGFSESQPRPQTGLPLQP